MQQQDGLLPCELREWPSLHLREVSANQRSKHTQNEYRLHSQSDSEMDKLHPLVTQQSLSQSEAFTPLSVERSIICSGKPI